MPPRFSDLLSKAAEVEAPLTDITPVRFACAMMASCPAVFRDENARSYVIIGKARNPNHANLVGRVGHDELVIEISMDLLEEAVAAHLKTSSIKADGEHSSCDMPAVMNSSDDLSQDSIEFEQNSPQTQIKVA